MRSRGMLFAAALAAIAAVGALSQQDPSPGEVVMRSKLYQPPLKTHFEANTKLVEVGVVVRDPKGHAIAGLTKNDFEISDEGKKREISAFSVETSIPVARAAAPDVPAANPGTAAHPPASPTPARVSQRYVALLFDDTSMEHGELVAAQAAALQYVKEGMRAGDHVGLFTISEGQVVAFATDSAALADAIGKLRYNLRKLPLDCPRMSPYEAYLIANHIDVETFSVKIGEKYRCSSLPPLSRRNPPDWNSTETIPQQVLNQASVIWEQVAEWSRTNLITIGRVVNLLAQMPGDRTMLIASSGFLDGTLTQEMDQIIREAVHTGVVISAIDAKGLFTTAGRAEDGAGGRLPPRSLINMTKLSLSSKEATNDAPAALAINTGGLFFENRNDLETGFRELGIRPEVRYLLAFTPAETPNGQYHHLKVRLKTPGQNALQSRQGYVAVKPSAAPKAEPEPERPIDTAAAADNPIDDLPGDLSAHQVETQTGEAGLMTVFHVDIKAFNFDPLAGARQQKLSLIATLTDAQGNFVVGKEGTVALTPKDGTFQDYSPAGMNFTLTLVAPPGSYRLHAAMADGIENKIRARSLAVEIGK